MLEIFDRGLTFVARDSGNSLHRRAVGPQNLGILKRYESVS